jgi:hypothetical protein
MKSIPTNETMHFRRLPDAANLSAATARVYADAQLSGSEDMTAAQR